MSVVLYRIDERLIHGQVVMGWGPELEVEHYVVVDLSLIPKSRPPRVAMCAIPG